MNKWDKLNKEFDEALDSMTKEDWDNWYKNVEQKRINQNKMTAVEFIAQELSKQIDNNLFMEVTFNKLLEQAKEMEKEQIKKSFSDGAQWELYGSDLTYEERAKQYYNTTFKSE